MRHHWWTHASSPWGPWAAFGLGRNTRFFEFGEVRLAILSLLAKGPKHGYQLMKEMQDRSGGLYRVTDAGRRELGADPDGVRRIWERAESWEHWGQFMGPQVFAFAGPIAALMKATLRATAWAAGQPERDERIREILQRACRDLDQLRERRP
jgi:hypothetical protein